MFYTDEEVSVITGLLNAYWCGNTPVKRSENRIPGSAKDSKAVC